MAPESVVLHSGALVFNGAMTTMLPAFMLGATFVVLRAFDAEAFARAIYAELHRCDEAGADLIELTLSLTLPDGSPNTPAAAVKAVKDVLGATGLPLLVFGPGQAEIDNALLVPIAEATQLGVIQVDEGWRVVGFEEKPEAPKSDLIPIGVYFLRPHVFDVIDALAPSGRGEFEITDVLNHYIPQGGLYAPRYEGHWADAGTVPSLLRAAQLAAAADAEGQLSPPPQRPTA